MLNLGTGQLSQRLYFLSFVKCGNVAKGKCHMELPGHLLKDNVPYAGLASFLPCRLEIEQDSEPASARNTDDTLGMVQKQAGKTWGGLLCGTTLLT